MLVISRFSSVVKVASISWLEGGLGVHACVYAYVSPHRYPMARIAAVLSLLPCNLARTISVHASISASIRVVAKSPLRIHSLVSMLPDVV